jgi:hypothetical protein
MTASFLRQVMVLVGVASSCASPAPAMVSGRQALKATSSDHCRVAVAALDASVRPFSEQPLAMELACVNKLATRDGKIYVDARFTSGQTLEEPNVSICSTDRYVIRFDWRHFQPSPTDDVVLLLFTDNANGSRSYGVSLEAPDWPRRRPGTVTLSPCYSAFGVVRGSPAGWEAEVTPPPRSPDAL